MKLWVILDESVNESLVSSRDIIYTTIKVRQKNYKAKKTVYFDYKGRDDDRHISELTNRIFAELPDEWEVYKNYFFTTMIRPIANVLLQVRRILEDESPDEVILVGGSKIPFITLVNAEGEARKKGYRSSWLYNPIIYEYIRKNYNVQVRWIKRKNSFILHGWNIVRENLNLLRYVFVEVGRLLTYVDDSTYVADTKSRTIAVCELTLQSRHLSLLLLTLGVDNAVFMLSRGVDTPLENSYPYIRIPPNNILAIFKCLLHVKKRIPEREIISEIDRTRIKFDTDCLRRALQCERLVNCLKFVSFKKVVKSIPCIDTLITDMTYISYLSILHRYAAQNRIRHKNYQYVMMPNIQIPNADLADEYYVYSKSAYRTFHDLSKIFKMYLPIYRAPVRGNLRELTVTIFLQPDRYTALYVSLIEKLLPVLEESHFVSRVIVKPHYRQDEVPVFSSICRKYKKARMGGINDNVSEILKQADIMMSITSSVLFEAVSYGVMGIIIDPTGEERDYIFQTDGCVPEVNFYMNNVAEIMGLIENYDRFFDEYCQRREKYILEFKNLEAYEIDKG